MTSPTRENHAAVLAELATDLRDFKTELVAALDRPTGVADEAIHADTLEGKTPAQISALAVEEVLQHTSKFGQNVHGLDPTKLGTYTAAQFDAMLDQALDVDSGIPLDFYGDREFLPPAVTGSFESGNDTTPYGGVAMMMEDNGTLMILRSGTDGDTAGVYYSYLRNAMTETDPNTNLVMSNVEYRPAYFPPGMRAKAIIIGTQDIVTGIMKDEVTGAHTGYFISLTNNTLDQSKHTGVFVPNGNFLDVKGPLPGLYHLPFGFVKGNYVYILHDLHREEKIGHRVWRMPKSSLVNSVFAGATQIKGWTMNRGSGGTVVRDDILIFDNIASSSQATGKPTRLVTALNGSPMGSALVRDNGKVGVMSSLYVQYYPVDNLITIKDQQWYFRYEFDEGKVIDVAQYHDQKAGVNYSSNLGIVPWYSACTRSVTVNSHQRLQHGQDTSSIYSNVYNQLWLWTALSYLPQDTKQLSRLIYDEALDPAAVLAGEHAYSAVTKTSPVGRFGSPVTSAFREISNVGEDYLICRNFGRYEDGIGSYYARAKLAGQPTFQYSSVTGNYAFKGFAPNADRVTQVAFGAENIQFRRLLNEGSPGVSRLSQARFSRWFPEEPTRPASIDKDMKGTGAVTVPNTVMDSLETQILADLASRGYRKSTDLGAAITFTFELIVPQVYTDVPPFVVGSIVNHTNRAHYLFIYSVTITGSRQSVTSATIQAATNKMVLQDITVGIALGFTPGGAGQTCLRKVTGGYMMAYGAETITAVVGNGGRAMILFQYANGAWTPNGPIHWDYWDGTAPAGWVNLPDRGLFFAMSSPYVYGEIDCGTKMIGTLAAKDVLSADTLPELTARIHDGTQSIVLLSQRVNSAWTVFFADEVPAMLDGFYSLVKPLNHVLNPATDANKTFHVWLVREGDALKYKVVTTSPTPPATPALYLGYFTTNSTGLSIIDVRKRVAVGGKMLSPEPRGSAIPLTSGTPSTFGRLNWN